ncbi:hypothetical protein FE633_39080 [Streptomyces montanus]|uniref:Uncharacterized protein n=1 Tax=Streptomyces montanus TaxID=2580423 RepID=A0A5R9FAY2_9ACTN|nr:hypothetical protein FE633_39080 [Streptomyces montanus]
MRDLLQGPSPDAGLCPRTLSPAWPPSGSRGRGAPGGCGHGSSHTALPHGTRRSTRVGAAHADTCPGERRQQPPNPDRRRHSPRPGGQRGPSHACGHPRSWPPRGRPLPLRPRPRARRPPVPGHPGGRVVQARHRLRGGGRRLRTDLRVRE